MLENLQIGNSLSYKELLDIADAFQIASAQSFAIGKTKDLLEFISKGNLSAFVGVVW